MQRIAISLSRGSAAALFAGILAMGPRLQSVAQELVVTTGTAVNFVRQLAAMVVFLDISGATRQSAAQLRHSVRRSTVVDAWPRLGGGESGAGESGSRRQRSTSSTHRRQCA